MSCFQVAIVKQALCSKVFLKVPSYKLVYFPVRGRVQALRYIADEQGFDIKDEVVAIDQWPAYKDKQPFGQLPVLHDGDLVLGQSNAILRHIARKHGLYGKSDREAALIDMVNDQQEDLRVSYVRMIYGDYENGKDAYVKNIPNALASLEKFLGANHGGSGFFVGDNISFVDYNVFDLLDNFLVLSSTSLDALPKLKAFHARMAAREKIAKHRATDAFKKATINGNGKQ